MTYRTPVSDADLHAYVDDQLAPDRCRQVEEYLREHPEATDKVEEYQRINAGLDALYSPVLDEPLPAQWEVRARRPARVLRVAAVTAWMMIGGAIGWLLNSGDTIVTVAEQPMQTHLVQPAAFAHAVYTSEVRHPVEVSGQDEQHLVAWLSKRLHTDIKAPNLSAQGFALMGGRLLPSTNRMAAQFMYERPDGLRVTLYIRQGTWDNDATAFRFAKKDTTAVLYWIDGPVAYALVGELDRNELLALSEAVYPQLVTLGE